MFNLIADPIKDLTLSRVVEAPAAAIWKAWTTPELLEQWFCPHPYGAKVVQMDLRPGGAFLVKILGPDGQVMEEAPGCYLEVIPHQRLTWTSGLLPGFRPLPAEGPQSKELGFRFTAAITLESLSLTTTRYTAHAMHGDEQAARTHESMGFHEGWGIALDQLLEVIRNERVS